MKPAALPIAVTLIFAGACESTELSPVLADPALAERALDFGTVYIGYPLTKNAHLENHGEGPAILRGTSSSGSDRFTVGALPEKIPAGASIEVAIQFAPAIEGAASATIAFATDAQGPIALLVLGTGKSAPSCEDHNPCTEDRFDPGDATCAHTALSGACDDGSACTAQDVCVDGTCVGRAITCDDGVDCTHDVCDRAIGCTIIPDHTACPDDDPCTIDQCTAGGCTHDDAPDGFVCGEILTCKTANLCIFHQCIAVPIPEGAPCDDGNSCTLSDACTGGECRGQPSSIAPRVIGESTFIHAPSSGVFHDDRYLFVNSSAAGLERTKIIELDGAIAAPIADTPLLDVERAGDETQDSTRVSDLVAVSASHYARVRTSSVGRLFLDVLEASIAPPDSPALPALTAIASLELSAYPGPLPHRAITFSGHTLFFCANTGASRPEQQLAAVDLSDPLHPSDIALLGEHPCWYGNAIASGSIWMTWENDFSGNTGAWVAFRLSETGATTLEGYSFATDGVHRYGFIKSVHLDEHRAVIDVLSDTYDFALDFDADPLLHVLLTNDTGLQQRFVAVRDRVAYFEANAELRALDIADVTAPALLGYQQALSAELASPEVIALSDRWLVVRGGESGRAAILPRSEADAPIEIRAQGTLDRIRREPGGLYAYSRRTLAFIDDHHLIGGTVRTAPATEAVDLRHPVLIDNGAGEARGVFAPRTHDEISGCAGWSLCDGRSSIPITVDRIEVVAPAAPDADLPISWPPDTVWINGIASERCIGLATGGRGRLFFFDRCGGSFAYRTEVPLPAPPWNLGVGAVSVIHENEAFATMLSVDAAVLVDLRSPQAPVIAATTAIDGPIGAAFANGRWVLTSIGADPDHPAPRLEVYDVGASGATLAGASALVDDPRTFSGRILAFKDPLLLVAGERGGKTVHVFDVSASPPRVLHDVALQSTPLDAVLENETAIVARIDGTTVLSPICY